MPNFHPRLYSDPWKEDIPIPRTRLMKLTSTSPGIMKGEVNLSTNPMHVTPVSLKSRLDFLPRRYKQYLDLVLHGQETEYNLARHGYFNASALSEVIHAILECQAISKQLSC